MYLNCFSINYYIVMVFLGLIVGTKAYANSPLPVTGAEHGKSIASKYLLWHDKTGQADLDLALEAVMQGEFKVPKSYGSTGLKKGAFWAAFELQNVTERTLTLHLEYIDHQLINLRAFEQSRENEAFKNIADLSLLAPFDSRDVSHHRFVFPITLEPKQTKAFLVQYASDHAGFIFPSLRLWHPDKLRQTQFYETAGFAFMVGGLFLMAFVAFVVGLSTNRVSFYVYVFHAFASIWVWMTVLGFTHQFLIRENFHWQYMSIAGAVSIFTGIWFARAFLQTKKYMRFFDHLLVLMLANALFLACVALAKLTKLAVLSITLALLLYPVVAVIALVRWRQGSKEAGVFAIAWTFLVVGLFLQALRDLGYVEHNFFNYYWPVIASYMEMTVILAAMGMRVRRLRHEKDEAEILHLRQLEHSKSQLEELVSKRTQALNEAKILAENEARTDALTGVHNRRSFFGEAQSLLQDIKDTTIPMSVMMFDIDNFKKINDQYGHALGDKALLAFAKSVDSEVRGGDVFGRLGGEEFALAMVGSQEAAERTAHRLKEVVSDIVVSYQNQTIQFTTSVGLAHAKEETRIEDLLKRADAALYRAKNSGRNQVVIDQLCPEVSTCIKTD